MNFYKHHLGDYAKDTAHLSILEDGVYSRLLRIYYATEKPLPTEWEQLERLIGVRNKHERKALKRIISEFFFLKTETGNANQRPRLHNLRCDLEIEKYNLQANVNSKIAKDREAKKRLRIVHEPCEGESTNRARTEHLAISQEPEPEPEPKVTPPKSPPRGTSPARTKREAGSATELGFVKRFTNHAEERWEEKFGKRPTWQTKDYVAASRIIHKDGSNFEEMKLRFENFLQSTDRYVQGNGYNLSIFCKSPDAYLSPGGNNGQGQHFSKQAELEKRALESSKEFRRRTGLLDDESGDDLWQGRES